jgi:hypoxanthine phosphoribosyltransferase
MKKNKVAAVAAASEKLRKLYEPGAIAERVEQLALQIGKDFGDQPMVVVGVLKGSFMFMADLVRKLSNQVYVDFLRVSSYGTSTMSGGTVRIELDLSQPIENKNVLLIEDIVDTGLTLKALIDYLRPKKPRLLKACALLVKEGHSAAPLDYVGFQIAKQFVVGYGMDVAGRYRNLPYIAALTESSRK